MKILPVIGACLFISSCDAFDEPETMVSKRYERFHADPGEKNLRSLLNAPTDGEWSYLHMALLGRAFAENPDQFQRISGNLKTHRERIGFRRIAVYGDGVFEYHPDLKPPGFDKIHANASWLKEHAPSDPHTPH